MTTHWRRWLRYAFPLVTAGVVLVLFWPLVGELRSAAELMATVRWEWLGVALLLQAVGNTSLAALNYWLLRPFPGRTSFVRMMAILPAIAFIEVAVPSAGASGVVLRARLLGQSGHSVEAATVTLVLEGFFEACVRALIMVVGVSYLLNQGELAPLHVGFLAALALVIALALGAAWHLSRDPVRTERWLLRLVLAWYRLAGRLRLRSRPPASLGPRLHTFLKALAHLRRVPTSLFWLAAAGHIGLDLAGLGACFLAFGHALPAGTLLTGYSLTLLVSGLAVLPGALVLSEASLAVVFSRLGVPSSIAIGAALAYRLTAFWLLRLVGFITWQVLEARHERRHVHSPTL